MDRQTRPFHSTSKHAVVDIRGSTNWGASPTFSKHISDVFCARRDNMFLTVSLTTLDRSEMGTMQVLAYCVPVATLSFFDCKDQEDNML